MLKLAIIGCGRISYKHVQAAIDNRDKIKLTAVCDIKKEKAEQRAKEYFNGVNLKQKCPDNCENHSSIPGQTMVPKVYEDYKSMIESEEIDLVAISTESGYHAEVAIYCMNKGKHAIVEKPMALSALDAEEMLKTANKNNVKLCVSHQNRFNPAIQKLRKAVDDGRFGKIIAGNARILWNRGQNYYKQAPWRGTYDLDGGCLMNQCIHNIDLLQWMLGGDIEWVHGVTGNYIHQYIEAEDYGSIQIKFKNGAIGNVEGTVCIYPENLEETITIIGEKGTACIGGLAVNLIETWRFNDMLDTEEAVKKEFNLDVDTVYGNGHTPLYNDVIGAIENDRQPYINGVEGMKAMKIILAAYLSDKEEKRVIFPINNIASSNFK